MSRPPVRHYLDHASTTPLRASARAALVEWLERTGDPSRLHREALELRAAVELAREQVASCFGARPREVVFTSGATEAIMAATWGAAERGTQMVVPRVEHSAVREAAAMWSEILWIDVDPMGRVDTSQLANAITPETALVHVQWANHEVGTRQPVDEVVAACRERGVLVHVDAAAAAATECIDFGQIGADLLSVSAHKLGGPLGIGALLVRRGLRLRPLMVGGEQERARRAGIENVPAIVGFGAACAELAQRRPAEAEAARRHTERVAAAYERVSGVRRYGALDDRAAHVVCFGIEGIEPQAVLLGLDRAGVAAHSGSACASEGLEPSPVLEAMGVDAHRSLRISVGWNTTDADIDAAIAGLAPIVDYLRGLSRG